MKRDPNEEISGFIYLATNTKCPARRQYVGETEVSIGWRWSKHKYDAHSGSSDYFHRAISRDGPEAFVLEQIDTASTLGELDEKEIYWIKKLNTLAPNGYNLTSGGGGHFKFTDEVRKKMSDAWIGRVLPPRSEESRKRYSEAFKGRFVSPETCKKISIAKKGKQRKTCLRGHPLNDETACVRNISTNSRICIICNRIGTGKIIPLGLQKYLTLEDLGRNPRLEQLKIKAVSNVVNPSPMCRKGLHPMDEVNTYVVPSRGNRCCLTCYHLRTGRTLPEKLKIYLNWSLEKAGVAQEERN